MTIIAVLLYNHRCCRRRCHSNDVSDVTVTCADVWSGANERRLINDLGLYDVRVYNKLERPVVNESESLVVSFSLVLQQIIGVVSDWCLSWLGSPTFRGPTAKNSIINRIFCAIVVCHNKNHSNLANGGIAVAKLL